MTHEKTEVYTQEGTEEEKEIGVVSVGSLRLTGRQIHRRLGEGEVTEKVLGPVPEQGTSSLLTPLLTSTGQGGHPTFTLHAGCAHVPSDV